MSRKDDSKATDAIVTVNIDDFTRTRDSVIVSLAALQSAVSDLSRAYINHANTVLNRGPITVESGLGSGLAGGLASTLLENGLLGAGFQRHSSPPPETAKQQPEIGDKKKRKRAPPDPNAPKRALTPYFLYMQHNRPQIAAELGPEAKPKDVSDEGTRRWAEMREENKEVWKKLYADNLAVYKAKMKAYKAGLPVPDNDSAKADIQLQRSVAAAEAEAEAAAAAAEDNSSSSSSSEDESSAEEEPTKEPTPPPSGKRRRAAGTKATSTPVSAKKATPEKKKTPAPKAKETKETKETKEPTSTRKSIDSKPSKKKRKSDVGGKE